MIEPPRLVAALVLAALLAIVAQGWRGGRTLAARVAGLAHGYGRPRVLFGWAMGTLVSFALPALAALALLGRADAIATVPEELRIAARLIGVPRAGAGDTIWLLGCLALGAVIGASILLVRRRLGRGPIGLIYRSPAAVRNAREGLAASAVAVAAGVGEELFFRLALPLAAAIALADGILALALATLVFGLAHRHQGWAGIVATGIVGAGLCYAYLLTDTLWVPILLHVAIDLNALVLRPWLDQPPRAR